MGVYLRKVLLIPATVMERQYSSVAERLRCLAGNRLVAQVSDTSQRPSSGLEQAMLVLMRNEKCDCLPPGGAQVCAQERLSVHLGQPDLPPLAHGGQEVWPHLPQHDGCAHL